MHPTTSIRSESERELLDLHFHRRPVIVPGYGGDLKNEKAKTKASDPIQRRIAKGNEKNLQITWLGDDQERRPTPSQVAQHEGRELLASTKKTQWMRTAKKVKHRKPVPPMRKKPARTKNDQKNRDSF